MTDSTAAMQAADDAAECLQTWLDAVREHGHRDTGYPDENDVQTLLVDRARMAAELERRGQLLGVGADHDQWDAIAEAEGRRYEGEQTNDTIVGYLAYSRESARIARDAQRDRSERLAAELEQARRDLARARDDSSEAWLGKRIEALRKVLRDERDATRAIRIEADDLRQELNEATEIVADIGEALNTTELYIALGDLAQLFAPRTAALVERERAETAAVRPADSTPGAGEKRTPEQWCAEYDIQIADPDGWRNPGDPAWDEPITLPEYLQRAARSTTRGLTPDVWNRLSREAHRVAEVEKGPEGHAGTTTNGGKPA